MRIKLLALLCIVVFFISYSCTKTNTITKTVTDTVTKTVTDTVTKYPVNTSTLYLLTGKQWIFDSVYFYYTGPGTGTLIYAKGGINTVNYGGDDRFVLWPDGTEDYFHNGTYGLYSWSFLNADSTQLLFQSTPLDYCRILKLSANYLTLYDSTASALSYYTVKP